MHIVVLMYNKDKTCALLSVTSTTFNLGQGKSGGEVNRKNMNAMLVSAKE